MKRLNITYFDLETTGVSINSDKIVSIYAHNPKKKYTISTILDPEVEIPQEASDVHGITNEMVKGKPTLDDIKMSVKKLIGKTHYLCGYNIAKFDIPMLINRMKEVGVDLNLEDIIIIDLFYIVKQLLTDEEKEDLRNLKLETIYEKMFGRTLDAHEAMADTKACMELLEELANQGKPWHKHLMNIEDVKGQQIRSTKYRVKFGKYHGDTIKDILSKDERYIKFCMSKGLLSFSPLLKTLIKKRFEST